MVATAESHQDFVVKVFFIPRNGQQIPDDFFCSSLLFYYFIFINLFFHNWRLIEMFSRYKYLNDLKINSILKILLADHSVK